MAGQMKPIGCTPPIFSIPEPIAIGIPPFPADPLNG